MGLLEVLLTPQLLVGIVLAACAVLLGRSVVSSIVEGRALRVRLEQVEMVLRDLLAGLPEKRQRIAEIRRAVRPLQAQLRELQVYYARLVRVEQQADQKEEEAKEDKPEPESEIRVRRRGLDDLL
jgi:hypothetical protein